MRLSCLLSYTDHVPLEAINKELSRHESNSQQAIIMELSCEESCCSAGNNQAAEQAGITWPAARREQWRLIASIPPAAGRPAVQPPFGGRRGGGGPTCGRGYRGGRGGGAGD